MPTEHQIEEAKSYVLRRVQAEQNILSRLDDYLLQAADKIIEISSRYNISPSLFRFSANKNLQNEVNEVIAWLKSILESYTLEYSSIPGKIEEKDLWPIINRERNGKTFRQRLHTYASRWGFELEAFIAAGLLKAMTTEAIQDAYKKNYRHPYNFIEGKGEAVRLKGASYGTGRYTITRNMLSTLLRATVADAWMMADMETAKLNGATGFYSYRGSSYPCSLCDSMTGYHPIIDFPGIWHPNCKCYFVFV